MKTTLNDLKERANPANWDLKNFDIKNVSRRDAAIGGAVLLAALTVSRCSGRRSTTRAYIKGVRDATEARQRRSGQYRLNAQPSPAHPQYQGKGRAWFYPSRTA